MTLKKLSLTEHELIKFKKQKIKIKLLISEAFEIVKSIKFKYIIFFIMIFLFSGILWYMIAAFCAIYQNTQISLFKDTLFSFALSMVYPFGYYLIPGTFRIPALKDKKKNSQCLFNFGTIFAI